MSGLKVVTGPSIEPISRLEARDHLRLDEDLDDAQVRAYIKAARVWAENYTGRAFISRSMQYYLNGLIGYDDPLWEGFKDGPYIEVKLRQIAIPISPVISVSSINYYSDTDVATEWPVENYYVDTVSDVAKIVLRDGASYPSNLRNANGIEVNFTAGYGASPNDVPEDIRVAILQYMTFLYEHRGDFERFPAPTPPAILRTLLNPYRVMRFGLR